MATTQTHGNVEKIKEYYEKIDSSFSEYFDFMANETYFSLELKDSSTLGVAESFYRYHMIERAEEKYYAALAKAEEDAYPDGYCQHDIELGCCPASCGSY